MGGQEEGARIHAGEEFTPDTAVSLMLRDFASWTRIERYLDSILRTKKEEETARQHQPQDF